MTNRITTAIKYVAVCLVMCITHWLLSANRIVWKSLVFSAIVTLVIAVINVIMQRKAQGK